MTNEIPNPNLLRSGVFGFRVFGIHSSFVICHSSFIILAILLISSLRSLAHDPYEITSTLSLYTNRAELQVELEFKAGMLLAGHAGTVESSDPSAQFNQSRSAVNDATRHLFRLSVDGRELRPSRSEVSLGVENHIRFTVLFPPITNQALSVEAPGLKALSDQGPYGASLTVLDMVNRKVLGQSVLFNGSPVAEFRVPEKAAAGVIHVPQEALIGGEAFKTVDESDGSVNTPLKRGVDESSSFSGTIFLWAMTLIVVAGVYWLYVRRGRKENAAWSPP